MTIFSCLKNWCQIRALEKKKKKLVSQLPPSLILKFNELHKTVVILQKGTQKDKARLVKAREALNQNGFKEITRKIKELDDEITRLRG